MDAEHAAERIADLQDEIKRLREHETWLKLGHETADGFLDGPSQTHIVDKVCIIGHERDELRTEVKRLRAEAIVRNADFDRRIDAAQVASSQMETERDRLRKLVGELRDTLPIERLEEGGDPGWLADLKRRAAEAAKEE